MKTTERLCHLPRTTMAAAAVVALGLLLGQSARAQFTYTGGALNADQTYDGLGVDSGVNPLTVGGGGSDNYIGNGSGVSGSITVLSGTLTINGNDTKIAQWNGTGLQATGTVTVAAGATLNINQIGLWGGGVGQRGVGTVNIASGGALTWQTSGSTEQRFMFGNGASGLGILNLNGGTLYNFLDPAQTITDADHQFRAGSDGGAAVLNLNSGTWVMGGDAPFALGCKWTGLGGTPAIVPSAPVSVMNIQNGVLLMTNVCTALDGSKATFTVGDNDYVNFAAGGTGSLSLIGWAQADYEALVNAGQIRVNSNTVTIASFQFSTSGGQGILQVSDPVATTPSVSPTNVVYAGETAILSEAAFGTSPFTYQWQADNGTFGATFSDIAGATFVNYTNNTTGLTPGDYQYRVVVTNNLGNANTSAPVTLTVMAAAAPFITVDTTPTAVSRYVGGTVTFNAEFDGNHPIAYQWQLDGGTGYTNVPGATASTLTRNSLQFAHAGNYRLTATNSIGGSISTPATLTVLNPAGLQFTWAAPVSITNLTANQILTNTLGGAQGVVGGAVFGNTAPIIVTLAGGRTITFKNDGSVADSTGSGPGTGAYPGDSTNTTGNANFDSVLNQFKHDGGTNTITVNGLIPGERYSVQLFALDNRSNNVARLAYFLDGDDAAVSVETSATIAMGANAYIVGTFYASNSTETISQVLPTGGAGNINALVLRALSFVPASAPVVLTHPASKSVFTGRATQFSVVVDSYVTPYYQWQTNGVNVPNGGVFSGVNTDTLTIANVAGLDTYQISCVATNPSGSATGGPATLTVLAVPPGSGSAGTSVLAQNPVAYWPLNEINFNDGTGTSPAYEAIAGNDGHYRPSAANAANGIYGPQSVDGFPQFAANQGAVGIATASDSWVTTPALNLNTNTATITMWVNPEINEPGFTGLLLNRNTGSAGGLHLRNNNELGYTWVSDNSAQWGHATGLFLPVNTWSLVALVITPTNTIWYMFNTNGLQTHAYTINNPVMPWSGSETNIAIGKDPANAARVFTGRIDEVAMFNRSLSQDDVLSLVGPNPVFTTQPQSVSTFAGAPVQFSAAVWSQTAVTYRWKTNGVDVANSGVFSGADTPTLSISDATGLNGLVFTLGATNASGGSLSAAAILTVEVPAYADMYWDIDDANPGAGGTAPAGNWSATSATWTTDSTGAASAATWTNGDSAIFSAGTDATAQFNVTASSVIVHNLTQEEGRVRVTGGTLTLATVNSTATVNTRVSGDYDLRLDSVIANSPFGPASITKEGAGILLLTGANNPFSGGVTLNNGTLAAENTGCFGTGPITLNGGSFVRNWNAVTTANPLNVRSNVNVSAIQNNSAWTLTGAWQAGTPSGNFNVVNVAVNGINPVSQNIFVTGDISAYGGTITHNCLASGGNRLRFGDNNTSPITVNGATARFVTTGSTTGSMGVDLGDNKTIAVFRMGELSGAGGTIRASWSTGGNTTFEIGHLGTSSSYSGVIRDNLRSPGGRANLAKVGAGTLELTVAQAYSGFTAISNGTLRVNAAYLADATNVIIAASGKLDLNFAGTDTVRSLFIGGAQKVAGTYGATGSGAANIDDVHFAGTGVLNVTTGPDPVTLVSSVTGNQLSLSWPAGWGLQAQTNALSVGLSNNWVTLVPGSSGITSTNLPINPANPTVFYRLVYP